MCDTARNRKSFHLQGVLRKPVAASTVLMRDEENNEVIADGASDRDSEKEASLRLVWEGEPMWDDDGMFGYGTFAPLAFLNFQRLLAFTEIRYV